MADAKRAARWTAGMLIALIALVIAWQLSKQVSAARFALALALLLSAPLWLPAGGE